MKEETKEILCSDCEKPYEPDQYTAWCNKCGPKHEKEFWNDFVGVDENGFMYFRKK